MFASTCAVPVDRELHVSKDVVLAALVNTPVLKAVDQPVHRHALPAAVAKAEASPAVHHVAALSENDSLVLRVVEISIAIALRVDLSVAASNMSVLIAGSKVVVLSAIGSPVRVAVSLSVNVLLALAAANFDVNASPVGLHASKVIAMHAGQGRGASNATASLVLRRVMAGATTVSPDHRADAISTVRHDRRVRRSIAWPIAVSTARHTGALVRGMTIVMKWGHRRVIVIAKKAAAACERMDPAIVIAEPTTATTVGDMADPMVRRRATVRVAMVIRIDHTCVTKARRVATVLPRTAMVVAANVLRDDLQDQEPAVHAMMPIEDCATKCDAATAHPVAIVRRAMATKAHADVGPMVRPEVKDCREAKGVAANITDPAHPKNPATRRVIPSPKPLFDLSC